MAKDDGGEISMSSKICRICGIEKLLSEFSNSKVDRDGYRGACKPCSVAESRQSVIKNWPRRQVYCAEYRLRNLEALREADRLYRKANREKKQRSDQRRAASVKGRASSLVKSAVYLGYISKPISCSECGAIVKPHQLHGHHADYSRPREVIWLCSLCHGKQHRKEVIANEGLSLEYE